MHENLIVVCGPVDAGKSSLIGVLTKGDLDDGRGLARSKILSHNHELKTGRTSNISFNPIKYVKEDDKLFLYSLKNKKKKDNTLIKEIKVNKFKEDKVISFIDLAGHEKYLKTTVYGITGLFPNYGIVVIGANTGITKLTKEHIGFLLYLKIPFIITITKIDLAPKEIYLKLCNKLKALLNSNNKVSYFISEQEEDTNKFIQDMINNKEIIPIISISNKNGINIDNLHKILYNLPQRETWRDKIDDGSIVYLDSNFNVPGIGLVLSGTIKGNNINNKQKMFLGPQNGKFKPIQIKNIHNSIREDVNTINSGVQGCFAIKFVNPKDIIERSKIKKGMVLVDDVEKWKRNIVREFEAEIFILQHSTTIKTGYSPVIHCGPIRQSAKIKLVKEDCLRSKDKSKVRFQFRNHSEFLEENMMFFFRDGNTKGVGKIVKLF
jgi:GTPase